MDQGRDSVQILFWVQTAQEGEGMCSFEVKLKQ